MKNIVIIDNFDSFTFNLVEYFRLLKCNVLTYRNTVDPQTIKDLKPDIIVMSPGPSIPKNAGNLMKIIEKYHKVYPMFGVCLGHEALIEFFGGSLKFIKPVHGGSSPITHNKKGIFKDIEQNFQAGRYHSLVADKIPECFEVTSTYKDLVMSIKHKDLKLTGVQFHPESVLTAKHNNGFKIIKNLLNEY